MRLVILESPYAGDIEINVAYARRCVRDSLSRGEAPIASHLLYTQPGILDDAVPYERRWGIEAGLAWRQVAHASVAYIDLGITAGMRHGIRLAAESGIVAEYRLILSEVAYFVMGENTLGFIYAAAPTTFCPLAGSVLKGGIIDPLNGPTIISDVLRPATVRDFADYRVSPKGHLKS